jgi:ankyrin repeat protein
LLIDTGADVNARNESGESAIMTGIENAAIVQFHRPQLDQGHLDWGKALALR